MMTVKRFGLAGVAAAAGLAGAVVPEAQAADYTVDIVTGQICGSVRPSGIRTCLEGKLWDYSDLEQQGGNHGAQNEVTDTAPANAPVLGNLEGKAKSKIEGVHRWQALTGGVWLPHEPQ